MGDYVPISVDLTLICHAIVLSSYAVSPCKCSALMEGLVMPLQDRIEEWKKTANQLDKDHAKGQQPRNTNYKYTFVSTVYWTEINTFGFAFLPSEYKRSRQEIKRKSLDTIKLQKKARKGEISFPQQHVD